MSRSNTEASTPAPLADDKTLLSLLESLERDGTTSQRRIAADIGVALGLVNAYLKRCIRKGLVKVSEAPARRYSYYLTPTGFAEKSRLTAHYLSLSLTFFRKARADCLETLEAAQAHGWERIALAGMSDLAEIAAICASDRRIKVVAVIDETDGRPDHFAGSPVVADLQSVEDGIDGVIVTSLNNPAATARQMADHIGPARVLAPAILGLADYRAAGPAPKAS